MSKSKKVAVITGATSGIGLAMARKLIEDDFSLILPCRNMAKGRTVEQELEVDYPDADILIVECDFSDLSSVKYCGERIVAHTDRVDLLVNNAGVANMQRMIGRHQLEETFVVNHLAPFVLTAYLLPLIKKTENARIVNTSSEANYQAQADFLNDVNFEHQRYAVMKAYANSKFANILFTLKLARLLKQFGVVVNCAHPGRVATGIWPKDTWYQRAFTWLLKTFYLIPPEKGAEPLLRLSVDGEFAQRSGVFLFENEEREPKQEAYDEQLQDLLWQRSMEMAKDYLPMVNKL